MNGTGTQKFSVTSYIRGDIVVEKGTLLMNASGTGKSGTLANQWGVGDVYLKGGQFGAVGASSEIGAVMANSITFQGGGLLFDIDGANTDTMKIIAYLEGSTAISLVGDAKAKFEFNFINFDDTILSYEIMDFSETSVSNSLFAGAEVLLSGNIDSSLYEATVGINSSGNLSLNLTLIPEPSTYAALFGIFALAFALRRREQK